MGNEKIYQHTSSGSYQLQMEMRSNKVGWVSAEYSYFALENETNWYRLHLGGFSGDCSGDSMQYTGSNTKFNQNGMYFTTYDSLTVTMTILTHLIVQWGGVEGGGTTRLTGLISMATTRRSSTLVVSAQSCSVS